MSSSLLLQQKQRQELTRHNTIGIVVLVLPLLGLLVINYFCTSHDLEIVKKKRECRLGISTFKISQIFFIFGYEICRLVPLILYYQSVLGLSRITRIYSYHVFFSNVELSVDVLTNYAESTGTRYTRF